MSIETTIIVAAVVLWFAQGWYLNTRLERVHKKLDLLLESFDGLRTYLYEIDPNPALNGTGRFGASTWRASARPAG